MSLHGITTCIDIKEDTLFRSVLIQCVFATVQADHCVFLHITLKHHNNQCAEILLINTLKQHPPMNPSEFLFIFPYIIQQSQVTPTYFHYLPTQMEHAACTWYRCLQDFIVLPPAEILKSCFLLKPSRLLLVNSVMAFYYLKIAMHQQLITLDFEHDTYPSMLMGKRWWCHLEILTFLYTYWVFPEIWSLLAHFE